MAGASPTTTPLVPSDVYNLFVVDRDGRNRGYVTAGGEVHWWAADGAWGNGSPSPPHRNPFAATTTACQHDPDLLRRVGGSPDVLHPTGPGRVLPGRPQALMADHLRHTNPVLARKVLAFDGPQLVALERLVFQAQTLVGWAVPQSGERLCRRKTSPKRVFAAARHFSDYPRPTSDANRPVCHSSHRLRVRLSLSALCLPSFRPNRPRSRILIEPH